MSSTKCPQCGLVNFSTALECKRCQLQLNQFAPITEQRSYQTGMSEVQAQPQTAFHQSPQTSFRQFQAPPPPPNFHHGHAQQTFQQPPTMPLCCIKCRGSYGVSIQNFKKDYVPPVAYLGMLAGVIPMLILVLVLKVTHQLHAPFCDECWGKFRRVSLFENLSAFGFFGLIGFGIFAVVVTNSGFPFFLCFALAIGSIVWGQVYKSSNSPKFKRVNREQVVLEDPTYGEVSFQR